MPPKRASSRAKSTTAAAVKVKDTNVEDKPQATRAKRSRAADDDEADEALANNKRRKPESKPTVAEKKKPASKAKPPTKATTKVAANGATKPAEKPAPAAKAAPKPKMAAESKPAVPGLNPLPTLRPASRPSNIVFVWGASDSGQLGLGENHFDEVPKPRRQKWVEEQVEEGTFGTEPGAGIVGVAAGGLHTYLLDENSKVWSSGTNDEGALGRITKKEQAADDPTPKAQVYAPIETLVEEGFKVCQIATGDNYGAALNDQGDLKVWGTFRDDEGKSSFSSGVGKQMLPISISILGQTTSKADKISAIAGGENHLVALTTKGEVYSWGIGGSGQLGRRVLSRHKSDALLPQRVVLGIRSRKAVLIGSGLRASFAVDESGGVWAWGLNSVGQLGIGERGEVESQPTLIEELSPENLPKGPDDTPDRVVQIDGGEFHSIFRTAHGHVYTCGACNDFQLGLPEDHEAFDGKGTREAECVEVPTLVPMPPAVQDDDKIVSVCAGPRYNMAVTQHGVLLSWGVGVQSELGLPSGDDSATTPQVVVRREGGFAVQQVSCGGQHVIGLFKRRESP